MKLSKLLLLAPALLSGCAVIVEYPITSASLAVLGATGKGPTDHALSEVTSSDCKTMRLLDLRMPCQRYFNEPLPPVEDRSFYSERKVAKM
jgi:hypothetical protein